MKSITFAGIGLETNRQAIEQAVYHHQNSEKGKADGKDKEKNQ